MAMIARRRETSPAAVSQYKDGGPWGPSIRAVTVSTRAALIVATRGRERPVASALNDPTGIHEPAIYSSRWIEDGSFTRLANITIGYTFNLPSVLGVARGTRAYLSGDNLHLWTPYTGYDPEVFSQLPGIAPRGVDYLHYPRPRTITGGLRVQF